MINVRFKLGSVAGLRNEATHAALLLLLVHLSKFIRLGFHLQTARRRYLATPVTVNQTSLVHTTGVSAGEQLPRRRRLRCGIRCSQGRVIDNFGGRCRAIGQF